MFRPISLATSKLFDLKYGWYYEKGCVRGISHVMAYVFCLQSLKIEGFSEKIIWKIPHSLTIWGIWCYPHTFFWKIFCILLIWPPDVARELPVQIKAWSSPLALPNCHITKIEEQKYLRFKIWVVPKRFSAN